MRWQIRSSLLNQLKLDNCLWRTLFYTVCPFICSRLRLREPTEILLTVSFTQQRGDCERCLNGLIINKNKRSEIGVLAWLDL